MYIFYAVACSGSSQRIMQQHFCCCHCCLPPRPLPLLLPPLLLPPLLLPPLLLPPPLLLLLLQDAMGVARNIMLNPRLVPGGGAVEMAVSRALTGKTLEQQLISEVPG
jgi:hypothetical protein